MVLSVLPEGSQLLNSDWSSIPKFQKQVDPWNRWAVTPNTKI